MSVHPVQGNPLGVKRADVPNCYLLTVCSGSAVDQHTNNASLFNLVEQINVPSGAELPPNGVVPLEMHAYWQLEPSEISQDFYTRFVMLAASGLETSSNSFKHRPVTTRFRTRTVGLPYPPVLGAYVLQVDYRFSEEDQWLRSSASWPLRLQTVERLTERVTH